MKLSLSIKEAISINQAIQESVAAKKQFKPKVAFRLSRIAKQLNPIIEQAEQVRVQMIQEKYGEQVENNGFKVKNEKMQDYLKAYNELLGEKEEIEISQLLSVDDFEGNETYDIDFFFKLSKIIQDN
ncbi:MAG: hypothetical protein AAFX87_24905 [Bacteroidota bacterium]